MFRHLGMGAEGKASLANLSDRRIPQVANRVAGKMAPGPFQNSPTGGVEVPVVKANDRTRKGGFAVGGDCRKVTEHSVDRIVECSTTIKSKLLCFSRVVPLLELRVFGQRPAGDTQKSPRNFAVKRLTRIKRVVPEAVRNHDHGVEHPLSFVVNLLAAAERDHGTDIKMHQTAFVARKLAAVRINEAIAEDERIRVVQAPVGVLRKPVSSHR